MNDLKNPRQVKFKKGRKGYSPRFPSLGAGIEDGAIVVLSPEEFILATEGDSPLAEQYDSPPEKVKAKADEKQRATSAPVDTGKKGNK